MRIELLKEFLVLTSSSNYAEASEQLFLSQSSLSAHIKSLENELGVNLFVPNSHTNELTQYGKILIPYASEIVSSYNSCLIHIQSELKMDKRIFIATIPNLAAYHLTQLFSAFRSQNPEISLDIKDQKVNDVEKLLFSGQIDFAFMAREAIPGHMASDMICTPICTDYLVAVIPEPNPLSDRSFVELSQLASEDKILLAEDSLAYGWYSHFIKGHDINPENISLLEREQSIISLSSKENTIALMPKIPALYFLQKNQKIVPLYPEV